MSEDVTAAGKSIDIEVYADPASCASTVAQLVVLADSCLRAEEMLARHVRTTEEQFGGLSGIVYRQSSMLLGLAAHRTAGRSRKLADGLAAYATGMAEVQRLMDDAAAAAAPYLLVAGGRIWSPSRPPGPDDTLLTEAWWAWSEAVDRWRAGRRLEEQTSREWLRVVDRGVAIDGDQPPPVDLPLELPLGLPHDPADVGGVR